MIRLQKDEIVIKRSELVDLRAKAAELDAMKATRFVDKPSDKPASKSKPATKPRTGNIFTGGR